VSGTGYEIADDSPFVLLVEARELLFQQVASTSDQYQRPSGLSPSSLTAMSALGYFE